MANAKLYFPKVLKFEGGYQCDPKDTGNYYKGVLMGTNKGVTPAAYFQRFGVVPTASDMKNLTDTEVYEIMKLMYWDLWKADKINNQSVAEVLVDWVWGSGIYGIKEPQKVLNVVADGKVGQATLSAVNSANQRELFDKLQAARKDFLNRICIKRPANKKFLKGWLNRVNEFQFSE